MNIFAYVILALLIVLNTYDVIAKVEGGTDEAAKNITMTGAYTTFLLLVSLVCLIWLDRMHLMGGSSVTENIIFLTSAVLIISAYRACSTTDNLAPRVAAATFYPVLISSYVVFAIWFPSELFDGSYGAVICVGLMIVCICGLSYLAIFRMKNKEHKTIALWATLFFLIVLALIALGVERAAQSYPIADVVNHMEGLIS